MVELGGQDARVLQPRRCDSRAGSLGKAGGVVALGGECFGDEFHWMTNF